MAAQLRQTGDWTFLNIRGDQLDDSPKNSDKPERKNFVWMRVKRDGKFALAWTPERKTFEQLVKDGVLSGEVKSDTVIIEALAPKKTPDLENTTECALFEWDDPMVFFKISDK